MNSSKKISQAIQIISGQKSKKKPFWSSVSDEEFELDSKYKSIENLEELGCVDELISLLDSEVSNDNYIRRAIVLSLGNIGNERAAILLIEELNSKKMGVSAIAASGLGNIYQSGLMSDHTALIASKKLFELATDLDGVSATDEIVYSIESLAVINRDLANEAIDIASRHSDPDVRAEVNYIVDNVI